jgi:LysM repeat protein
MKKWNKNGLCAKDMCHLSKEGYSLKGQLCANAILQSYLQYLQFPQRSLLLKDTVQARVIEEKTTIVVETKDKTDHPEKNNKPQKKKSGGHKVHVVKKGESLYSIAKKYNTTVAKLKSLNKLKSDTIKQGQKLYVS